MENVMKGLPHPDIVADNEDVQRTLRGAFLQAEDQTKAAMRCEHLSNKRPSDYLLFVGPYWTHVKLGPFVPKKLSVRARKPLAVIGWMIGKRKRGWWKFQPGVYCVYLGQLNLSRN
ncbi:hypothetical protein BD779DRAFT_339774 [Infundibulicybe gibba]|nr:hypothetical protein BD779DRAFT_339774 [Infundibulicybe gibba]